MKWTVYRVLAGAKSRTKMYELNNNKLLLSRVLSLKAFLKFLSCFLDTADHILLDVLGGMKLFPFHFHFNFGKWRKSAGANSSP
jgi:hypothetical protein